MAWTFPQIWIFDPALLPRAHLISYSLIFKESSPEDKDMSKPEVLSEDQEENNQLLENTK